MKFTPWGKFRAVEDKSKIRRFLKQVGEESEKAFKKGNRSSKSGIVYSRPGGSSYRASAPGEYPAMPTGRLDSSIKYVVRGNRMDIGTSVFYAKFLREGTRKMRRRKMSDDALKEGLAQARPMLEGWVEWKRF